MRSIDRPKYKWQSTYKYTKPASNEKKTFYNKAAMFIMRQCIKLRTERTAILLLDKSTPENLTLGEKLLHYHMEYILKE
jgi:hypothetical protein